MPLFYRVAKAVDNSAGSIGPYNYWKELILSQDEIDTLEAMSWDHCGNNHPTPEREGLYDMSKDEICGFDSPQQLVNWFGGWLERLSAYGWQIFVYHAKGVRVGYKQSVAKVTPEDLIGVFEIKRVNRKVVVVSV